MPLQIVWRNPQSFPKRQMLIEQIVVDDYGALYAVRNAEEINVFELILHRAA